MPHKSRRGRARHPAHRKQRRETPAKQPGIATKSVLPATSTPAVPSPPPSVSTPKAARPRVRYTYVTAELKRIGILAGILVAILIILALVLP